MMMEIGDKSSDSAPLWHLRACLVVLAWYLWLIVLVAGGAAGVHFFMTPLDTFRIDAVYQILCLHTCGAILTTLALGVLRGGRRVPVWSGKAALAMMPLILGLSCDRLALLTYPPARLDPNAALFAGHPTRLWTLRPNTEAPSLGVTLNERAMRGPVIPFEKAPGEQRVLVLGDSVAFGGGAPYEQCFDRRAVELLERDGINGVTFVNLSCPGYSPWQHIDVLGNEGMAYDPDVVIYAFCMNDVVDWLWRDVPGHDLSPRRFDSLEVSGLFRLARGLWQELRLWSVNRTFRDGRYALEPALQDADTPGVREAWRILLEHVGQLVTLARERDRRIAFLIFPTAGQVRCGPNEAKTPQRRLVAYAEANGVPYLDLAAVFMEYCDTPGRKPRDLFIRAV